MGEHVFFFFQAEDGKRGGLQVTGVQACALPIGREGGREGRGREGGRERGIRVLHGPLGLSAEQITDGRNSAFVLQEGE